MNKDHEGAAPRLFGAPNACAATAAMERRATSRRANAEGGSTLRSPRRRALTVAAAALVLAGLVLPACGKKGPPLAPLIRVPARIDQFAVRRMGDTVHVRLRVPTVNQDGSEPADIRRVEIYAFTGSPGSNDNLLKYGTLVGTIDVRKPPPPEEIEPEERKKDEAEAAAEQAGEAGGREAGAAKQGEQAESAKPGEHTKPAASKPEEAKAAEAKAAQAKAVEAKKAGETGEKQAAAGTGEQASLPKPGEDVKKAGAAEARQEAVGAAKATKPAAPAGADKPGAQAQAAAGQEKAGQKQPGIKPEPVPVPGGTTPQRARKERPEEVEPGVDQGSIVVVTDPLTAEAFVPVVVPVKKGTPPPPPPPPGGLLLQAQSEPLARIYVAVGVNRRGRRGPFSARLSVPLEAAPAPPGAPSATYDVEAISLSWQPPANARRPIQLPASGDTLKSRSLTYAPLETLYNVYPAPSPAVAAAAGPNGVQPPPAPPELPAALNEKPLETPSFSDPRLEFGVERCYVVRTVDVIAGLQVESEPSAVTCVTPKDTFPPPAPAGLVAVRDEALGGVSLSWDAPSAPDIAGYLVLRGEAPDGRMTPLMDKPIRETTWLDTTLKAGVRYVYAVVAVDNAAPPNTSPPSNRVEETGR